MASRPFFDKTARVWCMKWKSIHGWKKVRLCPHPGWTVGDPPPKRPPSDALRLARGWEDRESAARAGVEGASTLKVPLGGFLDGYLLVAGAGQAPGTMRLVRRVIRTFREWCDDHKVAELGQVTADVCRRYLAERSETVAHSTLKSERAILSPAWSVAFQDGRVRENPWKRAPVPGKAREERPPFWSEEEVRQLVAACRPWLADVVTVGAYTGLRITSLLGLTWEDVDFTKGTVHVRAGASKSGRAYDAPMLGPAREALERRRGGSKKNPLVFPGPKREHRIPSASTYRAIKRAVKRAGVTDHGRFNHVLRHSFATWAVNRGVPLAVVSRWLGHSSITMTLRYTHADSRESQRWTEFFDSGGGHRIQD